MMRDRRTYEWIKMPLAATNRIRRNAMKTQMTLLAPIVAIVLAVGNAGATTLTGCLKGVNPEGVYELTNSNQKGDIEVGGSPMLAKHVGHTVKLTGTWVKSGAEIGEKAETAKQEKEEAGKEEKENERHFKVSSIQHISAGCTK
jgi:hypothetical protein